MLSTILIIIFNILVLAVGLTWGFMLSTNEYPVGKHEKKFFIIFLLVSIAINVLYWT